tara:strand:- start:492 stop:968 length:477 start_codon:yes stop_codon:yes gene_type:complete
MGNDDKWAKVINYLKTSGRDPDKVLRLLKGNQKGKETNYTINRSSYSLNIIAVLTQKTLDPKNKGKGLTHIIRHWAKSKDFEEFYNLLKHEEKKKWSRDDVPKYVKQLKDIWYNDKHKKDKKYFKSTGGYFIVSNKNLIEDLGNLTRKGVSNKIMKIK